MQLLALLGSNFGIKNDSKMTNNLAETIAYVQKIIKGTHFGRFSESRSFECDIFRSFL